MRCPEGEVTCDNVRYVGTSRKTGKSISDPWESPRFLFYQGAKFAATNQLPAGSWSAVSARGRGYAKLFQYVAAFPLPQSSADQVAVVTLTPGEYTMVCDTGAPGDVGGEVLIEVYGLP